jgi:hypothetical protein
MTQNEARPPEVERAYATVAQFGSFAELRRFVAATYADMDDTDSLRTLMVHLHDLHTHDPAEINYWRNRRALKDGPFTLESARIAVAEVLIQMWRKGVGG